MAPVEHQFQALKLLGLKEIDRSLELWPRPDDERWVENFLKDQWLGDQQVLVGIHPAASEKWPTKQWLPERFAELCDLLAKRNVRVVITGDSSAGPAARKILGNCQTKPLNAVGKTDIGQLIALVRRCRAFITLDSAPMHIAAGVGTPFVALFGPTDPQRHLPDSGRSSVIHKDVRCSPCYLRSCPVGLLCMKKISTQEVLDRVTEFLSEPSVAARA